MRTKSNDCVMMNATAYTAINVSTRKARAEQHVADGKRVSGLFYGGRYSGRDGFVFHVCLHDVLIIILPQAEKGKRFFPTYSAFFGIRA